MPWPKTQSFIHAHNDPTRKQYPLEIQLLWNAFTFSTDVMRGTPGQLETLPIPAFSTKTPEEQPLDCTAVEMCSLK